MIKIAFSGAAGVGKSTLARAVAAELPKLSSNLKTIEIVPEYAREYINKYGATDHPAEQLLIFSKQLSAEKFWPPKTQIILCDSPVFLGLKYTFDLRKPDLKSTKIVDEIFSSINQLYTTKPHYDIVFHIPPTFIGVDDGTRKAEHLNREWLSKSDIELQGLMLLFKQPYLLVNQTSIKERAEFCSNKILEYFHAN